MSEPIFLLIAAATFFLAGTVKGVIGLGLPTVCLALLTVAADLPIAMALLLVPSFVTNLWQGLAGGQAKAILKRLWPFLAMATLTVWIGGMAITPGRLPFLSGLLGLLLIIYGTLNLAGLRITVPRKHERWSGMLLGTANGVLTGMTGSFVVPGVMFLQAIGMPRDTLIQAMGILFTLSTLALAVSLNWNGLLSTQLGLTSFAGLLPAVCGMILGQKIRHRLPEARFRTIFFGALLLLGTYIAANAAAGLL